MKGKLYFQISLLVPILFPFLIGFIFRLLVDFSDIGTLAGVMAGSLAIGGIPYIIFGLVILLWSINKTESDLRKLSYFAPLIFLLFFITTGVIYLLILGEEFTRIIELIQFFSVFIILIGYFYVLIVNVGYELFLHKKV